MSVPASLGVPEAGALFSEAPFPYLVTTASGTILLANTAAGALLGHDPQVLTGQPLDSFAGRPSGAVRRLATAALDVDRPITTALWVQGHTRHRHLRFRATVVQRDRPKAPEPQLLWEFHPIPSAMPLPLLHAAATDGDGPPAALRDTAPSRTELLDAIDDLGDLTDALLQLASLALDEQIEPGLDRIATVVTHAASADGASVTGWQPPSIGGTCDEVRLADEIQYEKEQGPCVLAMRTGQTQLASNLGGDPRWQPVGTLIGCDCGYRSTLAVPLRRGDETIGVLGVYAARQDAFDRARIAVVELLAEPAAAALVNLGAYKAMHHQVTELRVAAGR